MNAYGDLARLARRRSQAGAAPALAGPVAGAVTGAVTGSAAGSAAGVGAAERAAAVLILFGALDNSPAARRSSGDPAGAVPADLDVLLLERASSLRAHPGQIAFPGGRLDPEDDGPIAAALREAHEETGLDAIGVDVLGAMPPLPLSVSNHLVTPVLAWWSQPGPVRVVDTGECAAVFRLPVADLIDPTNRYTAVLHRPDAPRYRGPAFVVGPTIVWGFTAHVLDALFTDLAWAEPWDKSHEVVVDA